MLSNYNSEYSGVYQSNIVFEDDAQNFVDQENWGEESSAPEKVQDIFICPAQPEAEA